MKEASAQSRGFPITDKGPTTPKDLALVSDLTRARDLLLRTPPLQGRIQALRELPRNRYWHGIDLLVRDTDRLFSAAEIHLFVADWDRYAERIALNVPPAIGATLGRTGRGRRMNDETIDTIVRSLELRLAGDGASQADEQVAHAYAAQSGPGVYRKRLRDRRSSSGVPACLKPDVLLNALRREMSFFPERTEEIMPEIARLEKLC